MNDPSAKDIGRTWRKWSVDVEVYVTDPEGADVAAELLAEHLDQLDAAVNRFRADSEIRRLPTVVSPLFACHLEAALDAARETNGVLDPTVGGLLVELGYDADIEQVKDNAVERPHTSRPRWQSILLEGTSLSVADGTVLDLGSTSKALAADDGARMIAEPWSRSVEMSPRQGRRQRGAGLSALTEVVTRLSWQRAAGLLPRAR
jgi:thiamine biosynthesis lipoprotein